VTVRDYYLPASLPEALDLLKRHGSELLVIAGGTVAMPLVNEGISLPERVMGLRRAGLDAIERDGDALRIGAAATLAQLTAQDAIPLLREAAASTANPSIRNMGTVGGNLFTPPPGGDVAVALLALDARVHVAGPHGERMIPIAEFFTGFMATALAPDELVVSLRVPLTPRPAAFLKFGRKHANTPAVVTVAAAVECRDGTVTDARIALGAAGPFPMRATDAEAGLIGGALDAAAIERAAEAAAREAEPFTDAIATAWYRRRMVQVFVRRALESAAAGTASVGEVR
jgi:CO/xanthine dehydrogenase FAD-binding subunit